MSEILNVATRPREAERPQMPDSVLLELNPEFNKLGRSK
jgi:hypothetical protein